MKTNVGGKNLIKMSALKDCFDAGGLEDVTTYIQSGNVVFRAPRRGSSAALVRRIEEMLASDDGGEIMTAAPIISKLDDPCGVGRRAAQRVTAGHQDLFGTDPDGTREERTGTERAGDLAETA